MKNENDEIDELLDIKIKNEIDELFKDKNIYIDDLKYLKDLLSFETINGIKCYKMKSKGMKVKNIDSINSFYNKMAETAAINTIKELNNNEKNKDVKSKDDLNLNRNINTTITDLIKEGIRNNKMKQKDKKFDDNYEIIKNEDKRINKMINEYKELKQENKENKKMEDFNNIVEDLKFIKREEYRNESPRDKAYNIANDLIKIRNIGGNRFGIRDEKTNTNLVSKHYSPLIVRKYNIINGWPLFVSIICDENLEDLDSIINGTIASCKNSGLIDNNIQKARNLTGILSETIINYYNGIKENCVEGVGITIYADKLFIENFFGDAMCHLSVRMEILGILNIMPHI